MALTAAQLNTAFQVDDHDFFEQRFGHFLKRHAVRDPGIGTITVNRPRPVRVGGILHRNMAAKPVALSLDRE
ncbi:MAG: hypothetical protein WBD34_14355 [Burkholderiaceae bacterium]